MLARLLEAEAQVAIALSGSDALNLIEKGEPFDLILCDVLMPGMSGLELFHRVHATAPAVAKAFVFVTGGAPPEIEARLQATGVRCLEKPLDLDELRRILAVNLS
jgi:CheY-like chemotaxis protein